MTPSNIGAHSNYRHEDYHYLREQSRETRRAEWEYREPPLSPRWKSVAGVLFILIFVTVALVVAGMLPE